MQKRQFRRDFGGGEDTWEANKRPRADYNTTIIESPDFAEYYKAQEICPPEEWEAFLAILRVPLPLTFRINGKGRFADALRSRLESDFFAEFASGPITIDGEVINPPSVLPWYPDKLGWQYEFSRSQLRKIPILKELHEFMKRETEIGAITRQEAVSMVPPLFLDAQPHHRILDMCAAPGSKTAQLLEALHVGHDEPTGVVVANDADAQRCNMLTHQTQRMRSPSYFITNHDAQNFPLLWDLDPSSTDTHVLYDRILCDVPCSGDGTIRKQPDIWRRWNPASGNGLHILQLRITLRACELLKVGGRVVYSTCTFNPIEDEAVVAEVLRRTNGSMKLVDVSDQLPALKRQKGLLTWKVKDRNGWYSNWEEGKNGFKLDPSMFPQDDNESLGLEHCMRYLPQHQNTGGFFVCVLEKVAPLENLKYPTLEHRGPSKWDKQKAAAAAAAAAAAGEKPDGAGAGASAEAAAEGEPEAVAAPVQSVKVEKVKPTPPPKVLPEWGVRGGGARDLAAARAEEAAAAAVAPDAAPTGEGAEDAAPAATAAAPEGEQKQQQNQRGTARWRGIDPIVPFNDKEEIAAMRDTYGLGPECAMPESLISRSTDARPKRLSYISPGCKLLLRMDDKEQLKVTAGGLKMFERQENKDNLLKTCYRIAQEGLPNLLPYMTKQRFQPTVEEFIKVLKERAIGLPEEVKVHITKRKPVAGEVSDGAEAADGVEEGAGPAEPQDGKVVDVEAAPAAADADAAEEKKVEAAPAADFVPVRTRFHFHDPSTLQQLGAVEYGCCVATLRAEDVAALELAAEGDAEGGLASNAPIAIVCWRGRGTLNVLVSKQECAQMADRLEAAVALKAAAGNP
jgi:16S rRNA C967 or C1407 C5-methylase (RsmB/RsmF family)